MATTYTHPHYETYVIDNSIYTPLVRETLPLFRPIFFMRAQQGKTGIPMWIPANGTMAAKMLGEGTFDMTSKYYSREALYLSGLLARQGAFVVRLASQDAKASSLVLELQVKNVQVPMFETDENGQYILNEDNERIAKVDEATGAAITEPGVELKWTTRALDEAAGETIKNLKAVTYGTGNNAYTVYPIFAAKTTSVGAYGNDLGVKLYVDLDDIDTTLAANVDAIPYTFGAVKKTYGADTVSPIHNNWGDNTSTIVAKPDQTDIRTDRQVSFNEIMNNDYVDALPFDVKLYSENIATVGRLVMAVEPDDETLTDPYMVNLTEAYNIEDVPMQHVVFSEDDDSIALTDSRILYLSGGDDGTITDQVIEEMTRQYLQDLPYPDILDQARYPFTHIVDTGVSLATKASIIQFMGEHDAFKAILSTQDANLGRLNTKAEDYSTGSSLYAKCLLQPECAIKGTECCRAEIYQQAGYLADSNYTGIVPSTYDIMLKKSQYLSTERIQGQPAGLPNAEISIFKSYNWVACDKDLKQKSWDSGLNYFQHFDMTGIHWPAMRTVYRYDTSVLSNAMFTDALIFTKHIARYNWSKFAGVEQEFTVLATRAQASMETDMTQMLNGFYNFDVAFSQNAEEAKIGYISHATVRLWGNPQQRVWKIDIECYRNGYDPTTAEE